MAFVAVTIFNDTFVGVVVVALAANVVKLELFVLLVVVDVVMLLLAVFVLVDGFTKLLSVVAFLDGHKTIVCGCVVFFVVVVVVFIV